jgi:hypothetical protein
MSELAKSPLLDSIYTSGAGRYRSNKYLFSSQEIPIAKPKVHHEHAPLLPPLVAHGGVFSAKDWMLPRRTRS